MGTRPATPLPPLRRLDPLSALDSPRLVALLDTLGTFVGLHDLDARIVHWNAPPLAFNALTLDEVRGRSFWDVADLDGDDAGERALREAFARAADGETTSVDVRVRGRDGTRRVMRTRVTPFRDESSEVVGIVLVGEDATAEVEAQGALARTTESLRVAEEAGGVGSWVWDVAQGTITWSPSLFALYGLPVPVRPEVTDAWTHFRALCDPDDFAAVERMLAGALADGARDVEQTFRLRRAGSGERRVVSMRASIEYDALMAPVRLAGVNVDVTDREAALQRARESEARFRRMADDLPVLVWEHDAAGHLEFVNRATVDFLGVPATTVTTPGWIPPLHPDDHAAYEAAFTAAVGARVEFHATARLRHHDGTWRSIESWGRPRIAADGTYFGYIGTSIDITDRLAADARAREASEALRATATQLADADRRKDDFLALLAHELRNPLAPVRYAAQLLARAAVQDPLVATARGMIERQASHMTRLVDDLLDVSRITRGKFELQREPLDLVALVTQVVDDQRAAFARANVTLGWEPPSAALHVDGDPVRLAQAVDNVLHNAAKFTPAGGTVTIRVTRDEETATIAVADTGVGVPPDVTDHLFEAFTQVGHTVGQRSGGLGLGLALVRGVMRLHGGEATLASEGQDRGTTVRLTIPHLRRGDADAPVVARQQASVVTPSPVPPLDVLVVEDHEDGAQGLVLLLRLRGHRVRLAVDAEAALHALDAGWPDAIVSDLGLPGALDGYGLATAIRARPGGTTVPLIALSGFGRPDDVARSAAVGFDAHLVKPISHAALERALAEAIVSRGTERRGNAATG